MMKIVFVSRVFAPGSQHGGAQTNQHLLGSALVKRGHRVRIITSNIFAPNRRLAVEQAEMFDGIEIRRIPVQLQHNWDGFSLRMGRIIRDGIRGADAVATFGLRHQAELLVHVQNIGGHRPIFAVALGEIPVKGNFVGPKDLYDRFLERRFIARAAGVVATSEPERDDLIAWGVRPDKLVLLPGYSETLPAPSADRTALRTGLGLPHDHLVLFWSGRIDPIKGLDLLFEVLAGDIRLSLVTLALAGDDNGTGLGAVLAGRAEELGIEDRVRFMGWCNAQQRADLCAASDAFVLPSVSESFSRSAAEAIIAGVPLLASETCGVVHVAAEATLLFERSVAGIREALVKFMADPELQGRLREGTKRVVPRLSPDAAGVVFEHALYDGLDRSMR